MVLLSSQELDTRMQMIFKDPKWANRVVYIRGSVLKDIDLKRCRYLLTSGNRQVANISLCVHFAQERKDIFGRRDVVESFRTQ